MKKYLAVILLCVIPQISMAGVVTTNVNEMTRLYAYDDYGSVEGKEGAAIFIYLTTGVPECPSSIYISPNAPGYKNLVSFALAAFMAGKPVSFQVYNDTNRQLDGRCEVDAVRLDKNPA